MARCTLWAMRKSALPLAPAVLFGLITTLLFLPDCAQAADGDQQIGQLHTCKLAKGREIDDCFLGYRTWGTLNAQQSNAILFPTWFSGNSSNIGEFVGPDKMIDPAKFFLIAVDALGDGVSSSPSNSGDQHGAHFPQFTIGDMVAAEYRLVTEVLHLKHLHAVMGISMGGMQTFEWMVRYPAFMDRAVPIVGSPRLTSYDLLLWQAEVEAAQDDPLFQGGNYSEKPKLPLVEFIHTMNVTTPAYYTRSFTRDAYEQEQENYYRKGILPFDANDWVAQLGSHDPPRRGQRRGDGSGSKEGESQSAGGGGCPGSHGESAARARFCPAGSRADSGAGVGLRASFDSLRSGEDVPGGEGVSGRTVRQGRREQGTREQEGRTLCFMQC